MLRAKRVVKKPRNSPAIFLIKASFLPKVLEILEANSISYRLTKYEFENNVEMVHIDFPSNMSINEIFTKIPIEAHAKIALFNK